MLATFFESPGEEFPPAENNLNGHASVLQNTYFSAVYPSSAYDPCGTNNAIILRLTRRLRRQTLSIPDYTRAKSALHGCRPSAAETTPLSAATSVAERRLLRFSSDSCTALVLG